MPEAISRRSLLQLAGAGAALWNRNAAAQRATPSATLRQHIDPDWFRKALAAEIDHWRTSAELPTGFVQQSIDRQWRPVGEQTATLTSQGRHMFMRARGYDLTRNPAYLESARRIADFTLAHFRDTQYGGLFFSVSTDGKVVDERKDSYGTAFAIFGFSHAARITRDEKYRNAALETWAQMKKGLRDQAGFFKPATTRDYTQAPPPGRRGGAVKKDGAPPKGPQQPPFNTNTQNPMMHLFEALLALHDATGSKDIYAEAEAHANAMFTKLFQDKGGYLPEFYDAQWKPLPEDQRGHPDLGHQFEWAYLWSQAVNKGFPARDLQSYGERLLSFGMKSAYDTANGGIYSVGDYAGNPVKAPKGLWQQCEFLRAIMNYAAVHNHNELWQAFDKSLSVFKENFMDAQYGGCFSTYYDPKTPPEEARLRKNGIDCYHVSGMYSEALRLTGVLA
jgi:mannose/cellobiose epimerase-like protein (N-acyl-D-glucosamine 2-epimerase family)